MAAEEAPSDANVAAASAVPSVLVKPPWRTKAKRITLPVLDLQPQPLPDVLRVEQEEREAHQRRLDGLRRRIWADDQSGIEAWLEESIRNGSGPIDHLLSLRDEAKALHYYRSVPDWAWITADHVQLLAVAWPDELERLVALVERHPDAFDGATMVGSVRLGAAASTAWGRRKTRPAVQRWMLAFPEHAAAGLIPVALGADKRLATQARLALGALHEQSPQVVADAAAHHGPEVAGAIAAWLGRDPFLDAPTRPPKRPDWFDAARFPSPTVDGAPIGAEPTEHLVEMLAFAETDPPYPGLAQVAEALDRDRLDAFLKALVDGWVAAGAPNAHQWTVMGYAALGGDARWLASKVEGWAMEGSKGRGLLGLQALTLLGNDLALMYVGRWSRSGRRQWLKEGAAEALDHVATMRGLSAEELEDRTAPDLDLDPDGSCVLDYGPRQFRVVFDETLTPAILDEDGSRLKAVARPRGTDDAALAKAAKERWAQLKKDAAAVATSQCERLERAMASGRRWSGRDLRAFLVEHPLVGHLAQRLVLGTYDADDRLLASFRVAEDRSFADRDDEPFALPEDAIAGIVHPLDLDAEALAGWVEVFADYALVQPFPQLARTVRRCTPEEAEATRLPLDFPALTGRLYALRKLGWRIEGYDYGLSYVARDLPGDLRAVIGFSPSIDPAQHQMTEHALDGLVLGVPFGQLAPRDLSELLWDVESLRG